MFQKYTVFKTETQHKTKKEIVDLIKSELGVVENDISVWNHMMQAISRISISEVAQSDGKWTFLQISQLILMTLMANSQY